MNFKKLYGLGLKLTILTACILSCIGLISASENHQDQSEKAGQVSEDSQTPQIWDFSFKGSYVNLSSGSRSLEDNAFFSNLQRLRLELTGTSEQTLTIKIISDLEAVLGNTLQTSDFSAFKQQTPKGFEIVDTEDIFLRHRLYRAYLQYQKDNLQITLGRQRIALGVSKIWSPTDLLNPFTPLSIEKEERGGVDALRFEVHSAPLTQTSLTYIPSDKWRDSTLMGRCITNISEHDFSVSVGKFKRDYVLGVDVARNFAGAGLRTEGTYTVSPDRPNFFRFTLGGDYTFKNSFQLVLEYYYNGLFSVKEQPLDMNGTVVPDPLDLARNNLGILGSYDITPLLRSNTYLIYAVENRGFFLNPEIAYNVSQNVDLSFGGMFFYGRKGSLFDRLQNVYYFRIQWFFGR